MTRVTNSSNYDSVGGSQNDVSGLNTVKNVFLKLVVKSCDSPEKHLGELSNFFNNLYHKKCLKSQVLPQKIGAFGALWDGASVIINTIEQEKDHKAKQSDLDLLKDDLKKLSLLF